MTRRASGDRSRVARGLAAGATALALAAGLTGCGSKPADSATGPQAQPPSSTKGTRPGGALGAALGGAEVDDPSATPPSEVPLDSSTTTAAPESSTTSTTRAPTTTAGPPVTQAPQQTVQTVAQQPQQQNAPAPSLSARAASQPNCPPGPANVSVTIAWTGSNLDGVQITGPGVSQSGPASGTADVSYPCHGTTRYNLAGSGPGGSATAYVDFVSS